MLRGFVPPFSKGLARHPPPWSTTCVVPAAPSAPNTPSPADAATSSYTRLTWLAAGQTKADVYLGTSASPPLLTANVVGFTYLPTLLPSTLYYWQIVAKNDGGSTPGPVWSFTTPSATAILVTIAGVLTTHVLADSLSIHDVLNAAPNTASCTMDVAPTVGQAMTIGLGTLDASQLIFAGTVQEVGESYIGTSGLSRWPVSLIDYTYTLNKRRPFGTWTNVSATTIAQTIVSQYAPGFTAGHVQAGLPMVSINFDGSADFMTCLGQLATAIAGFADVDYRQDVWLFQTRDATTAPDPIDVSHPPLNDPSPIAFSTDLSQVRTRAYGKGHGETVPCDVAAGETILPIVDASMFTASGGQAVAGTISGGAQSQKLTYAGVQLGGTGTLLGPAGTPANGPTVAPMAGSGIDAGTHAWAFTNVTASGETLPGPSVSAVLGVLLATPWDGNGLVDTPDSGGSLTPGAPVSWYAYAVSYVTAGGETTATRQPNPGGLLSTQSLFHLSGVPVSTNPAVVTKNIYRTVAQASSAAALSAPLYLLYSILNATTTQDDAISDAVCAAQPVAPVSNTATYTAQQAALSSIAVGPTGTTQRKVYRTVAGGSQLKLQQTIANNTATTATDATSDAALGANAPTTDTSALVLAGQANAGATSLLVANPAVFVASGGWVLLGSGQVVRYTGISGNTLTGIPASGVGAITTTVLYGSQVLPAPALTGINSWNGLSLAMAKGASVKIWVERNDLAAQLALGLLELDATGAPTDGIHEFTITDERRGEASLSALCDADLALFSRPIVSATYYTRDAKSTSGQPVAITLAGWGLAGSFTIQDVTITPGGPAQVPLRQVKASSVAFTLADLLRRVVLTP